VSASATIRDVAQHAGCSIATVSRVMNASGPVSIEMRDRVLAAIAHTGFRPSEIGRQLALRQSRNIGVVVPSLTNPVFATCLAGVQQAARQDGHNTIIAQSDYNPDRERAAITSLLAERPAALILTLCNPSDPQTRAFVASLPVPAVLMFNEPYAGSPPTVSVHNHEAGHRLARSLLDHGHQRIAFVSGSMAQSDRASARYQGFCAALSAAGLVPQPVYEVNFMEADDAADLSGLLTSQRPSGIVASNDLLALGVIAGLRRLGLQVPADVSVAGFDGIRIGRLIEPGLATIEWHAHALGVSAAAMALELAHSGTTTRVLRLDHQFRPGGTLAAAPVEAICDVEPRISSTSNPINEPLSGVSS
jgi:DNA-binding LacI/PurR family transcriptional regulator